MKIILRAQWGARRPKSAPATVSIASRTATCVHHDGPSPITVKTFAEACALVRKDQNYHMDSNGWADIGYNFLVINAPGFPAVDGMIFEARGRDAIGAHCLNHNAPWIGIQVALGGGQTPSPAALASVRWLHDTLENATSHSLSKKVHSDGFATACPDSKLRAWVKAGMPVSNTPPHQPPSTPAEDDMLSKEAQAWLIERDGANNKWITDNLRSTIGKSVAANAAQIAALTAAVTALAKVQPGVDGPAILAAVQAEVKDALASLEITLKTGGGV